MNVGELRELLKDLPDDMVMIGSFHSDYEEFDAHVVDAVDSGNHIMIYHGTMSPENKAKTKKFLLVS